jgi:dTMP kinase
VVADRYDLSTLAYQGWGRGLELETVRRLNDFATGGLEADLVLVLDVPVSVGRERQRRAGKTPDRMERGGTEFLERVRRGYREETRRNPAARLVDATGGAEEVHEAVVGHVRRELDG